MEPDLERSRKVGTPVDEEERRRSAEPREEPPEKGVDLGLGEIALTHLHETDASSDRRLDDVHEVATSRLPPVRHEHQAGESAVRTPLSGVRQRSGSGFVWIRPAHGLDASA